MLLAIRLVTILEDFADLALQLLERKPILLASARNESDELGLHILARKPSSFSCQGRGCQNRLMNLSKFF